MAQTISLHFKIAQLTACSFNYGQFTTLWDRLGGSYRPPNEELFRREEKMGASEWQRQAKEMEKIVQEVEGEDDREFLAKARQEKKVA